MAKERAKIFKLPVSVATDADSHARAETERNQRLFDWAVNVLKSIGLYQAVALAESVEALRKIVLDIDADEITLAIRAALHPIGRKPEEHFRGLKEGSLKQIIKNRFVDLKRDREKILRRSRNSKLWEDDLILDKDGKIVANLKNLILILSRAPAWESVLAFDQFQACVVIRRQPPWGGEAVGAPWTDHYETLTRAWFQGEQIKPAAGDVGRAVQAAARHNPFHPVKDYFDALVWDGASRLDTWLVDYFRADDSSYARAVGPRFLISAVARIFQPGCQVDHVIILEGPQGKKKSEALRTLAVRPEWFADRLSNLASKDAVLETAGVLLIEIAETDALTKATPSTIKSFLSRRYDRVRPPYGKHPIRLPRQCIFAASINPPVGGYLKDPTGARRFWPVACHGTIDRDGLEKVRDRLWAEAVHRYKAGEPWWLETPEREALAIAEQDARFATDIWEEPIKKWLGDRQETDVHEVLGKALRLGRKDQTQSAWTRVSRILTHLGFSKYRPTSPTSPTGRANRYRRDPVATKKLDE